MCLVLPKRVAEEWVTMSGEEGQCYLPRRMAVRPALEVIILIPFYLSILNDTGLLL